MNEFIFRKMVLDRIGIFFYLMWGYIGIIVFMIGDGLE